MSKNILNETDLKNVIIGATVVGAGGGGSPSGGLDLLEIYKKNHPDKPVELELLDPKDMEDGAYAAITAGMGAPRALIGKDFTPYAVNSYEALVEMAAGMGRTLKYACPVEIGGFNTLVLLLRESGLWHEYLSPWCFSCKGYSYQIRDVLAQTRDVPCFMLFSKRNTVRPESGEEESILLRRGYL